LARAGRRAPKPRRASPEGGLAALGRALAETLDPAIVARRTVESVRVLLGTRNAALYRIREDGTLDSIAFSGNAPEPRRPRPGRDPAAEALHTGPPRACRA
jgi:GAF domain-containing protein